VTANSPSLPVWLFVSYGGGHVKALLPVAQRVHELGLAQPVYLALTTAAAMAKQAGIPTLGFQDVMTPADTRARSKGRELVEELQVQAADRDESIAYLGLSYIDLEDRIGAEDAAEQYRRYGRQAFLPLGILERVINKCRPALVIATNSPRAEQAAIQTARTMHVPSVCLVDLLGIWERELLAKPDYADAVCVLNEAVRQTLIDAGRPQQQVHVTGNPAFDTVNDPALVAAGAQYRREAGWDGLHVCLYASSPEPAGIPGVAGTGDPSFPRRVERELIAAVQDNPALALWVRRHPSEARADDVAALAHPRIRVSPPEMPLHAAIHASDEVIVSVSTVGVEADLAGKSVTQVRGSILDHLSPYLAMGIADRELRLQSLGQSFREGGARTTSASAAIAAVAAPVQAAQRVVDVLRRVQEYADGR
jgi:hypothetical protein